MKVNEIFKSLQGEGLYTGYPVLFIRLSGCNRNCSWCDTKYHVAGEEHTINSIVKKIKDSNVVFVVWTGGEPALQQEDIYKVINKTPDVEHHLESNGDILMNYKMFTHINISPKTLSTAKNIKTIYDMLENRESFDIKVVTDLKYNKDLIPYATMLMPLTTDYGFKDLQVYKDVWQYCVKHNYILCSRLHAIIWKSVKKK